MRSLFFSLFLILPTFLMAGNKPLKVAIVNFEQVIQKSKAHAFIQKNVEEKREALQADVEKFEVELRKKESRLKDLQNKNDPTALKAKTDFENQVTDVQNTIKKRSKILSKAFSTARNSVTSKAMSIIKDIAAQKGYTLILPSNIVIHQEGYDITDDVSKRLDDEMPSVEIDFSTLSDVLSKKGLK